MSRTVSTMRPMASVRGRTQAYAKRGPMVLFITLIVASYWYCLPVVTQGLLGYSEVRGYDFLLLGLTVVLLTRYRRRLLAFYHADRPGKWLFRLAGWATLTTSITVVMAISAGNAIWIPITLVFLFHFWGFALAYAALRMFVRTREECLRLLDIFLVIGALEALVVCLQGVGLVPKLWGERYDVYGGSAAFCGTLGPNRTLPGHVFLLILAVAACYWRNSSAVKPQRFVLASVAAGLALLGLGLTGSRTAWVASAVFGLAAAAGGRPRPGLITGIIAVAICLVTIAPATTVDDKIEEIYEGRLISRLEHVKDPDLEKKLKSVDAGRLELWRRGAGAILDNPWTLVAGGGFNNYRNVFPHSGASAHNLYLTVLGELGIIGLVTYLAWLLSVLRETSAGIARATRRQRFDRKSFAPVEMRALCIAMMVSLWAGEILYPYRPTFSFLGMFLFVCAMLNHRALAGTEDSPDTPLGAPAADSAAASPPQTRRLSRQYPSWLDG